MREKQCSLWCFMDRASQNQLNVSVSSSNYCQRLKNWCSTFICHNMTQVCSSTWGGKAKAKWVQKRKKEEQELPAAGTVSKPAQALKDKIHFVLSSTSASPDEGSRGEEEGGRERERAVERRRESNLFDLSEVLSFNLQLSECWESRLHQCFYLPSITQGNRHSSNRGEGGRGRESERHRERICTKSKSIKTTNVSKTQRESRINIYLKQNQSPNIIQCVGLCCSDIQWDQLQLKHLLIGQLPLSSLRLYVQLQLYHILTFDVMLLFDHHVMALHDSAGF